MSTRAKLSFCAGDDHVVTVYQHCDGHPDEVLARLNSFFGACEQHALKFEQSTSFDDPPKLAALFIKWHPANDVCVYGVRDAVYSEYVYTIRCRDRNTRPAIEAWRAPSR